jgi:Uma2 family endonuclease
MTYDEWQKWADEDTHSEWVDGEVVEFVTATALHQRALLLFSALLLWYVERFDLGEVLVAGLHLRVEGAEREPDVLFVAKEHVDRIDGTRLIGPADLVVEIISDDSVDRDKREKFAQYAAAGVPEYWLFDPRPGEEWGKLYVCGADGTYQELPADAFGRLHSTVVPGFWFDPAWLWHDSRPALPKLQEMIVAG